MLRMKHPYCNPDEALDIEKEIFKTECAEVLTKSLNMSVEKDEGRHAFVLTADLITESRKVEMATIGSHSRGSESPYGFHGKARQFRITEAAMDGPKPKKKPKPPWSFSYYGTLKHEINEWLKI